MVSAPTIAIDGPVASGKTSVGQAAATQLGLRFLDTGLMYRAVAWLALRRGANVNDPDAMGQLAASCDLSLPDHAEPPGVLTLNGHPLTAADLASDAVNRSVSAVAAGSPVRRALVARQRAIAAAGGIVMVGRDIGSVVLPDADVKLYVDASPEVRARRRLLQKQATWPDADYQKELADTIRRDQLDSQRADSPLTVPEGAVVIDTEPMDFDQTVAAVVSQIRAATGVRSQPAAARS